MLAHDRKCDWPSNRNRTSRWIPPTFPRAATPSPSPTTQIPRVGALIKRTAFLLVLTLRTKSVRPSFGKLWSLHLNDQNGLKFDQDKPFGSPISEVLNQVQALGNEYGLRGEYVCFDVHPFRPTREEHWVDHLTNSRRTFLRLVEKARTFDTASAARLSPSAAYRPSIKWCLIICSLKNEPGKSMRSAPLLPLRRRRSCTLWRLCAVRRDSRVPGAKNAFTIHKRGTRMAHSGRPPTSAGATRPLDSRIVNLELHFACTRCTVLLPSLRRLRLCRGLFNTGRDARVYNPMTRR